VTTGSGTVEKAYAFMAASAWLFLSLLVLATIVSFPPLDRLVTDPGREPTAIGSALTILAGISALCLWVGALWHAVADPRKQPVHRILVLVVLVFINVAAAFFYYFVYALWVHRTQKDVQRVLPEGRQ
jgi:hypothetical protein